jgi:hypothetical protein
VLKIQFETEAMDFEDGHFTVPENLCRLLDVACEHWVRIIVQEPNGTYLFNGLKQLKSGTEIYGQDMKAVKKGRRILVIVSRAEGNCEYQGTELPGMFP